MHKRITFKNMEHSALLEEFSNKHLEKIEKLLESERPPISITLVLEAAAVHAHHKIELRVSTAEFSLVAHHEGPEMYQEIDRTVDKMVQEIRKAKDKKADEYKKRDSYKSA